MITQKKPSDKLIASWNKSREKGVRKYQAKRIAKLKEKKSPAVKKVSDARQVLNKIYTTIAKELKPLHPICECCKQNPATDIHHTAGRRGLLLIMSFYFRYICRKCHQKATDNSAWAREIGLSLLINSTKKHVFTLKEIELLEKNSVHIPNNYTIIG
jgi:hypothetical protein